MVRSWTVACAALIGIMAVTPLAEANAQDGFRLHTPLLQMTLRGGANQHLGGGALFGDLRSWLTLERSDFLAPSIAGELAVLLGPRVDLTVSVSQAYTEAESEYRDWEGSDGQPIEQVTTLRRVPAVASVRYQIVPRGRRIGSYAWIPASLTPYVGAGVGVTWYTMTQQGEFVDYEDNSIFSSYMDARGTAFTTSAVAGVDRWFTPAVGVNLEIRYLRASASGAGTFREYPSIDLSGFQAGAGVSLRL